MDSASKDLSPFEFRGDIETLPYKEVCHFETRFKPQLNCTSITFVIPASTKMEPQRHAIRV